ncbi:MAG: hypothetical protein PARBA_01645 [Parabacteroides sp.]|mgnify:CR=1 FL=1|jgi:putative anti-sigma factor
MKVKVEKEWQKLASLLNRENDDLPSDVLDELDEKKKVIFGIIDHISLDCDYRHASEIKEGVREELYHKMFEDKGNKQSSRKNIYLFLSIAASITLLIGFFLFESVKPRPEVKEEWIVFNSQNGVSEVVLPDSSVVTLNHGSRLSYSTNYDKSSRDVKLEGEACFQVAHNEHVPFIVKIRQIDIKVLGTVFNVSAYGEEEEVVTSLISGSVEIKNNMDNKHYHLMPNTSAVYDKNTKDIQLEPFEKEYAIGWTEGKLFFKKKSFGNICKSLERKFNCKITIEKAGLERKIFTGKFINNETLPQIFNIIRINVPFQYTIVDNQVTIY